MGFGENPDSNTEKTEKVITIYQYQNYKKNFITIKTINIDGENDENERGRKLFHAGKSTSRET